MIDDFIVQNWAFLKNALMKEIRVSDYDFLIRDNEAPQQGIFYGTQEFYNCTKIHHRSRSFNGTPRLFMRSYILSKMPQNRIKAIYMDKKNFDIDEDGYILGYKKRYRVPIFIFIED